MRVVGWITGLFVVAALGAGIYGVVHRPTETRALVASHGPALNDGRPDPPHVVSAPSPSAPTGVPRPPAAASVPVPTVMARQASIAIGSRQQQLINADRAAHGLAPLSWSGCLYNVAVANARRIAAQESLSHTNGPSVDLACRLGNRAGENIGYWSLGVNDAQLNTMFVNSPDHYANIMGPYHYVATAWVVGANGYGYVAVEFS